MPYPPQSSVPTSCQFCPDTATVTAEIDATSEAQLNKTIYNDIGGVDAPKEMILPAVLTASLQVTRSTATTQKHGSSGGAAVAVCSASSKAEAFAVTGKFCPEYPVFYMLPRAEVNAGSAIQRRFRVYFSDDSGGTPLFWDFDATYEYGNFDLDNNTTTGTDWNMTLRISTIHAEPVWDSTAIDADYTALPTLP